MKRITSIFLALSILLMSNFVATKSHALVGLVFKSKVVKVIGGIGAGGGATVGTVGLVGIATAKTLAGAIWGIIGMYVGVIMGGVGLIILDDKTVADVEFVPLSSETAPEYDEYSIGVYNSELEELNAIRKTIQVEVGEKNGVEESKALWNLYKANLSEETVEIAEAQAEKFIVELKKAF